MTLNTVFKLDLYLVNGVNGGPAIGSDLQLSVRFDVDITIWR